MPRDTLLDFFHDFAGLEDEFLIHDDGFHARHFRYREIAERARAFAAQAAGAGNRPRRQGHSVWRKPAGVDHRAVGMLARRRDRGSDRLPVIRANLSIASRASCGARLVLTGEEPGMYDRPGAPASTQPVAITKDQTAEIIFTSGATAEPKGVIITHRNILANIVPVENEVEEVPALPAAVRAHPIPKPAAAEPHVRPSHGDLHSADAPRRGGLHARIRIPTKSCGRFARGAFRVLVSVPQILEILRAHLIQMFPELRQHQASERPLAAPLVALSQGASACSDGNFGASSSARRRCRRIWKRSSPNLDSW